MTKKPPSQVERFYRSTPLPQRKTMLAMRRIILDLLPRAEEVVSYGMPAFKVDGHVVAGLLSLKNHVGYYPFSGSVLSNFEKELSRYSKTKSAIHVPVDKPLSKALIQKLLKARISQCPVKRGEVSLSKYEKVDGVWRELGLAAPARRALIDADIMKLNDLRKITKDEFLKLHGIGTNATKIIVAEMKRTKLNFKKY